MHSRALELVGTPWTLGLFQPAMPRYPGVPSGKQIYRKTLIRCFPRKNTFFLVFKNCLRSSESHAQLCGPENSRKVSFF